MKIQLCKKSKKKKGFIYIRIQKIKKNGVKQVIRMDLDKRYSGMSFWIR